MKDYLYYLHTLKRITFFKHERHIRNRSSCMTKNTIRHGKLLIRGMPFLMKLFLTFLFLISFSFLARSQIRGELSPDTIIIVSGKVVESHTGNGLFHVHIINLSRNRATLSDRFGYFALEAALYDTVYFSHVGFKKRLVRITPAETDSGGIFTVYLYQDTVMLKRFRVLAASRQVQFKHDFITKPFVPDTLNPAFEAFMKENHFSAPSGGIVLPGPFTLIYENFNKSARLQRRIERNRTIYYDNLPEEEKRKVLFHEE